VRIELILIKSRANGDFDKTKMGMEVQPTLAYRDFSYFS